ncbi:MAG TPA: hypothetical protein PKD12_16610 [Nitrospira sp.]|nr:hypothetical protein [Nitrospira sp.]
MGNRGNVGRPPTAMGRRGEAADEPFGYHRQQRDTCDYEFMLYRQTSPGKPPDSFSPV